MVVGPQSGVRFPPGVPHFAPKIFSQVQSYTVRGDQREEEHHFFTSTYREKNYKRKKKIAAGMATIFREKTTYFRRGKDLIQINC
jgi:hypothetical protein